jgi:hypothetical protein
LFSKRAELSEHFNLVGDQSREKALFNKEVVFEEIVEVQEMYLMPAENISLFLFSLI